jgi:hypothetical protein
LYGSSSENLIMCTLLKITGVLGIQRLLFQFGGPRFIPRAPMIGERI